MITLDVSLYKEESKDGVYLVALGNRGPRHPIFPYPFSLGDIG
jgi:hypothetical protein